MSKKIDYFLEKKIILKKIFFWHFFSDFIIQMTLTSAYGVKNKQSDAIIGRNICWGNLMSASESLGEFADTFFLPYDPILSISTQSALKPGEKVGPHH